MSSLSSARVKVVQADLVLLALVEIQRGGSLPSNAIELAALIGGSATSRDVGRRLFEMVGLGLLQGARVGGLIDYRLTNLGEQLLLEDIGGWEPEPSERARRERELLQAMTVRSR